MIGELACALAEAPGVICQGQECFRYGRHEVGVMGAAQGGLLFALLTGYMYIVCPVDSGTVSCLPGRS